MFICTPFGIGVADPAWYDHRLDLIAAITVPSLLAQEDQSFQWAVLVDPDLPTNVRQALTELLDPFEGRAFLHPGGRGPAGILALARKRGLVDDGGYVLTGRIDDDDAWHRSTVGVVRERVASWLRNRGERPGLALTFTSGLIWVMYEMVDVETLQRSGRRVYHKTSLQPYTTSFPSMSGFVYCAHTERAVAVSISHARIPAYVGRKGFDVQELSTDTPMWLYCRHKQAMSSIQRGQGEDDLEIDIAQLSRDFGIDEDRVERYIADAEQYGYALEKRLYGRRHWLEGALRVVDRRINDPMATDAQLTRLKQTKRRLTEEKVRISSKLVGDPSARDLAGRTSILQRPPSRIIQYWHSEPPPGEIAELLKTFGERNPRSQHLVFSESDAEDFIAEHFSSREVDAFRACALPAMQADYFRYCAVYVLGGIYADADYRCVRSLQPLAERSEGGELFFNYQTKIVQQVLNGFFVFPAPRHPFLGLALEVATVNIEERIADSIWPPGHRVRQAVGLTTGPAIFACMYFLRELGSFDAFLERLSGDKVRPFARKICEVVGDYERIAEVFDGIRISPYDKMMMWVGKPLTPLAYKKTESFWMNATMPIFR